MRRSRNAPLRRRLVLLGSGVSDYRHSLGGAKYSRCAIVRKTPGEVLVDFRTTTHPGGSK